MARPAEVIQYEKLGSHHALLVDAPYQPVLESSLGQVQPHNVQLEGRLELESGDYLEQPTIRYQSYGTLNANADNAILICHALTGSAHAAGIYRNDIGWWDALIGKGKAIDTDKFFVLCSNVLGSCYGTTGANSLNPMTGQKYRLDFPNITIRDMVSLQKALVDRLGIKKLHAVVGGSMGGMQVLEWAAMYPEMLERIVPMAVGAQHSAWAIGLNHVAREAITRDPLWRGGEYSEQPREGLALARSIAMISYRSRDSLQDKFGRDYRQTDFQVESYLRYQGDKLVRRFDANSYLYLTEALDSHDVARARQGTLADILQTMHTPALVFGINSDVLYPETEQLFIAEHLPQVDYVQIDSPHGHDAFLLEFAQMDAPLREFLLK